MTADLLSARSALVVAPHPDDESLGCGGLIAALSEVGATLGVLFVTDGGASHPRSRAWPRPRLAMRRAEEAATALAALGAAGAARLHLDLPDAGIEPGDPAWRAALTGATAFVAAIRPEIVLAPWRRDPHCDHRHAHALTREVLARGGCEPRLLEYAIWLDELGAPEDRPQPGEVDVVSLDIAPWRVHKRIAVAAHRSQLGQIVDDDPDGFALSARTVTRLTSGPEIYFEARA